MEKMQCKTIICEQNQTCFPIPFNSMIQTYIHNNPCSSAFICGLFSVHKKGAENPPLDDLQNNLPIRSRTAG